MKRFIIAIFLIGLILPLCGTAEEINFSEIYKPESITVDQNNIYITQGVEVFIYSKKNHKLINKFGKAGEGPKEFKKLPIPWIPSITIYLKKDKILINSTGKITHYSKDGKYLDETTTGTMARYIPIGDKYIFMHNIREDKVSYIRADLLSGDLKEIKIVSRFKYPAQAGKKRNPVLMARMATYFDRFTYKDKFVFPTDTNAIEIYDSNGTKLTSFTPPYTKVPTDDALKKELDSFFTSDIRYKRPYMADKERNLIQLPDYMPIFKDYRLDDDKIYIFSNYKKDGKFETFIYDFSGKLLKKTFAPLVESDILTLYPFTIHNGKIYQLVSDEDDEFKLRKTKI